MGGTPAQMKLPAGRMDNVQGEYADTPINVQR